MLGFVEEAAELGAGQGVDLAIGLGDDVMGPDGVGKQPGAPGVARAEVEEAPAARRLEQVRLSLVAALQSSGDAPRGAALGVDGELAGDDEEGASARMQRAPTTSPRVQSVGLRCMIASAAKSALLSWNQGVTLMRKRSVKRRSLRRTGLGSSLMDWTTPAS